MDKEFIENNVYVFSYKKFKAERKSRKKYNKSNT